MKRIAMAAVLAAVVCSAGAQQTLEERIKAARDSQLQREQEEARKRAESSAPPLTAPAGAPRVDLSGVRPSAVPAAGVAPMAHPQDQFELVQIKGFLDEPNSLEALIYYNGQRVALTTQQRRMPNGWELVQIGPEAVEIARGAERRQLRFVQFFQPAAAAPTGGAGVPAGQQPVRR